MKRFLMFLVIAIAVVSLGLTIYYFSVDNEVIYIKSSYLVVDKYSTIKADGENGLLDFRNRSTHTTLSYSVQQDEDNKVLEYNDEGFFTALEGGEAKIVIRTNNRSYARLVIDVLVCDGSSDYPFMVRNEEELLNMKPGNSYKLSNNIELTDNWNPINISSGTLFDGNFFAINNMIITDSEVPLNKNVGFASVVNGTIKNLFLTNININVSNAVNIGAFAGINNGIIQTSEASGTIINENTASSTTGGIAGKMQSKAKIDRCGFDGTKKDCGLYVIGSNIKAGGIVGINDNGTISESYSRGKVDNGTSGNTKFGGIVGENTGSTANIYDSYFYATEELTNTSAGAVGGIINTQNSQALVTGCYYGGNMANLTLTANNGSLISDANKYLDSSEFKYENNFITSIGVNQDSNRYWNFNGVWTIPTGDNYPMLNFHSSVGSTYVINPDDISTQDTINTAEKLYQAVKANDKDYDIVATEIDMTKDDPNFVWKPVEFFNHKLISKKGCIIRNLIIDGSEIGTEGSVALVQKMGSDAMISNITFDTVTIVTNGAQQYRYVGVIAGESEGAVINSVKINNVDVYVTGSRNVNSAFGTIFGFADTGTVINNVEVNNINVENGYYVYAGGFAGISYATITASKMGSNGSNLATSRLYNYSNNVKLVANFAGGIVGANAGNISYSVSKEFIYNNEKSNSSSQYVNNIYKGKPNVFVGGIVGTNEYNNGTTKAKGTIVDVYANAIVRATSGNNYKMYIGGIAGYNSNEISRAYVKASTFDIGGSFNACVGGITGYNYGKIADCVVDEDSRISTSIVSSVGTSIDKGNYILNTDDCTIVGGLVGYDAQSTSSNYSIYKCATYMKEIKGYYAGGVSGISFGKVQYVYCGESSKSYGGVSITGYLAGGLSSVVAGGFMKNCYTFCSLTNANGNYNYQNVMSVIRMEVSAVAGLTVFALNAGTVVEGCYAVTKFSNSSGVSYGSSADLTGFVCGIIRNCAYMNDGKVPTRNGTRLTEADFTGANGFYNFKNAIDATGAGLSAWNFDSKYPTLDGVNLNFPNSSLPKFD